MAQSGPRLIVEVAGLIDNDEWSVVEQRCVALHAISTVALLETLERNGIP
jgi:hypothetical protein